MHCTIPKVLFAWTMRYIVISGVVQHGGIEYRGWESQGLRPLSPSIRCEVSTLISSHLCVCPIPLSHSYSSVYSLLHVSPPRLLIAFSLYLITFPFWCLPLTIKCLCLLFQNFRREFDGSLTYQGFADLVSVSTTLLIPLAVSIGR